MDLDAAGEQQAKTLFVAALAQEKIHETKVLAAKAIEEISDLNDQLEAQKEAKSKVFAYLHEKLADSYDQIKELEAKFDHDRRQSNSKRVMYKLQLNGLEHKQREERSSERRRQDALRQEVELLERYEQELPSLAARLEELKEAADAEAAKAEEYKKVGASPPCYKTAPPPPPRAKEGQLLTPPPNHLFAPFVSSGHRRKVREGEKEDEP